MNDEYDDQENEPLTREEELTIELRLDEAQEQRQQIRDIQTEPDEGECASELIDGSWTICPCEDCQDRAYAETEG